MRHLITEDSHGYEVITEAPLVQDGQDQERADRIIAAGQMNYWWEKGGLENLPLGYRIVTTEQELIESDIRNCQTAFYNGNHHCQCGHEECPIYKDEEVNK